MHLYKAVTKFPVLSCSLLTIFPVVLIVRVQCEILELCSSHSTKSITYSPVEGVPFPNPNPGKLRILYVFIAGENVGQTQQHQLVE